jgi:NAD+ kinase
VYDTILPITKVAGEKVELSEFIASHIKHSAILQKQGIKVIDDFGKANERTVVVAIGGDGTVLYAAKHAVHFDLPTIGVNLGKVGFLSDIHIDAVIDNLSNIANPEMWLHEERALLEYVDSDNNRHIAMNDFVVSNRFSDSIVKYELTIGDSYAGKHQANSVIIATPTGSTAYALYVGGPIIEPSLDVIEIIPVAAMSMSSRPIIAPSHRPVKVKISTSDISLKADGRDCGGSCLKLQMFSEGEVEITIKQYEKKAKMLHPQGWNFFKKMTEKLGWAHQSF